MSKYFSLYYTNGVFKLFSKAHLATLFVILIINILIILWVKKFKNKNHLKYFEYALAFLLIGQEFVLNIWRVIVGGWSIQHSLPLHLCGVALFFAAIMLINKNYLLFELSYFWGLGGSIQAMLTPDLGNFGFPHFAFIQFFICHGAIVTAVLYMTFIIGYRPKLVSIWRVFVITNLYTVFIAVFNWLTNANYLYICHKPTGASLLDFMGPWPWYILGIEIVGLISCFIYYLPFGSQDFFRLRKNK